jgi:hypothetical protein
MTYGFSGVDDCAVERRFRGARLEDGEVFGVVFLERKESALDQTVPRGTYSCCLVLARGDEVGSIGRELEIRNLRNRQHNSRLCGSYTHGTRVSPLVASNLFPRFGIKQGKLSTLVTADDLITEGVSAATVAFDRIGENSLTGSSRSKQR